MRYIIGTALIGIAVQAVFLGLAIEGIARWGMAPLWHSFA